MNTLNRSNVPNQPAQRVWTQLPSRLAGLAGGIHSTVRDVGGTPSRLSGSVGIIHR